MAKSHLEKTLTALAGEYLVAGQICLRRYVASLTLKNYPGVDIFCKHPLRGRQVEIQVKTKRGGRRYYVPEDVGDMDQPFAFVYIRGDEVAYYIVPSSDVASISEQERREFIRNHPDASEHQPRMISVSRLEHFRDRWDLLGPD